MSLFMLTLVWQCLEREVAGSARGGCVYCCRSFLVLCLDCCACDDVPNYFRPPTTSQYGQPVVIIRCDTQTVCAGQWPVVLIQLC